MPFFHVLIEGTNLCIPGKEEHDAPIVGFFTSRVVWAPELKAAEAKALRIVRDVWARGDCARQPTSNQLVLAVSQSGLSTARRWFLAPNKGHVFFPKELADEAQPTAQRTDWPLLDHNRSDVRMNMSRSFALAGAAIGVALVWASFPIFAARWFFSSTAFIPITFLAAVGISLLIGSACVLELRRLRHSASRRRLASIVFTIALALIFVASALFSLMWGVFYGPAFVSLLVKG